MRRRRLLSIAAQAGGGHGPWPCATLQQVHALQQTDKRNAHTFRAARRPTSAAGYSSRFSSVHSLRCMGEEHATGSSALGYAIFCLALVLFGGLMSGLTLGLMSLTAVELEARLPGAPREHVLLLLEVRGTSSSVLLVSRPAQVLIRSGTETEKRQAETVMPVRSVRSRASACEDRKRSGKNERHRRFEGHFGPVSLASPPFTETFEAVQPPAAGQERAPGTYFPAIPVARLRINCSQPAVLSSAPCTAVQWPAARGCAGQPAAS